MYTYALDYPGPDAGDVSLDDLIPGCANDESAAGVDGGKKSVAVLEPGLEALEGFVKFIEEPF